MGGVAILLIQTYQREHALRSVNSNEDPVDIGRALTVDAVLEGSLQRENGLSPINSPDD